MTAVRITGVYTRARRGNFTTAPVFFFDGRGRDALSASMPAEEPKPYRKISEGSMSGNLIIGGDE